MEQRYFKALPPLVVSRYGSSTGVLIGAHRDPSDPSVVIFDESAIVAIPEAEFARYQREYSRAVRDGALKECTAEEYEAQFAKVEEAAKETPVEEAVEEPSKEEG